LASFVKENMVNGPILLNVTEFLQNLLRGFMEQACVIHEKTPQMQLNP